MPATTDPCAHLRVGTATEMADAVTRSHVGDGRVVGWYGGAGTVIDAEISDAAPPARLVARFGAEDFLGPLDPGGVCGQARRRPDARVAAAGTGSLPGELRPRRSRWATS